MCVLQIRRMAALLVLSLAMPFALEAQGADYYMAEAKSALQYFEYGKALKWMKKAIKEEPENADLLVQRSRLYLEMEKSKKAKKDLDAAFELDSMHAEAWIGLGNYYRAKEKLDTAKQIIKVALSLADESNVMAMAHNAKAEILVIEGEDSLALYHFEEAVKLDTAYIRPLKGSAMLLSKMDRHAEANVRLIRAYSYDRFDLEILVNIAYTFNQIGRYDDALDFSNYALELDPRHPITLNNRAFAHKELEMLEEALSDIKRSLANDGTNPLTYRYAGDIYALKKDDDKACKHYKQAEKYGYSEAFGVDLEEIISKHCPN